MAQPQQRVPPAGDINVAIRLFGQGETEHAAHPSLPATAALFARRWAEDLARAERFAENCPQACLTVGYEALRANPSPVLGDAFAFLGVAADADMVARCREAAALERLSAGPSLDRFRYR
jgi:hypothetical protein